MSVDWEELWEQRDTAPAVNGNTVELRHSDADTPYGIKALRDEAALVATAGEGTRNDTLNRAWYRMGKVIAGGNLTFDTARNTLTDAGLSSGLTINEVDLVLRTDTTSAYTAGTATPRIPPPLEPIPEVTVLPPSTGDPEIDADNLSNAVRDKFPLLDWHELWARDDVEEWIVEPILPARRLVALFSAPKVGKSLLMLELAVAVAQGTEALGADIDRPRKVLYIDFENDPRGDIYERLIAMGHTPATLDDLCYLSYPTLAKLDTYTGALELMAIIDEYACEVVVIDTISRAVAGEENENDTWLAFYRNTGLALKQAGISCIRLDHTGKDHDKGMRGGSAKYGDVDAVWKLAPIASDTFSLICTDHRLPITEKELIVKRLVTPTLHHKVEAEGRKAAHAARVEEILNALKDLDVDPDTGRDGCAEILREAGFRVRNNVISDAIKKRRSAAGLAPKSIQEELS